MPDITLTPRILVREAQQAVMAEAIDWSGTREPGESYVDFATRFTKQAGKDALRSLVQAYKDQPTDQRPFEPEDG